MIELLTTRGKWWFDIFSNRKKFDFRKGHLDVNEGDIVKFIEADESGTPTGIVCSGRITYVLYSRDFPEHFGWEGPEFTIIQFYTFVNFNG